MKDGFAHWKASPLIPRAVALALGVFGASGCAVQNWSKEPLPVSVSAANYSQVSGEELSTRVNAPGGTNPTPPAPAQPTKPLFYAFVPGQIYPSDVSLPTVYKELAVPLAHRGYFNVVYQIEAGLMPQRVDYLLRINVGDRSWKLPTVRTDKVTWGDDGFSSTWQGAYGGTRTSWLVGPNVTWDPRAGMSQEELAHLTTFFQNGGWAANQVQDLSENVARRESALILVEAYRFADVMTKKNNAPCIWATFIAVNLHPGQDLSNVLRTMAHKATPYFGETTNGLQVYEVPPGEVLLGEPVEVPGPQKAPQPRVQTSP